jgi:hypothetical protein
MEKSRKDYGSFGGKSSIVVVIKPELIKEI